MGVQDAAGRPRGVQARLSVMMVVFYFGIGAWIITLSTYLMSAPIKGGLNFSTAEVGLIYSTYAFGGMLAPLAVGVLTDRLFRAERVLGISNLLAAGLMAAAAQWCDTAFPKMDAAYRAAAAREVVEGQPALDQYARLRAVADLTPEDAATREQVRLALDRVNEDPAVRRIAADTFGPLFALMLGYCVCTQLGLTLTTVIALRNVPDPTRDFSRVRLYGTLGWIAAGVAIQEIVRPATTDVLYLGAAGAALTGLYCFTLPATPPAGAGRPMMEAFGLSAVKLFRGRAFAVFAAITFLSATVNQFYVVYGHRYLTDHGVPRPALTMTLAQVVEVACMFALPFLRPKAWMKPLMAAGLAGYALRGVVMVMGWAPAVIAIGVPMHGWSYALYYIVAATYLDREAPPHLRGSAQGIITFVAGGAAVLFGNLVAGWVVDHYRVGTVIDWTAVWIVPLVVCVVLLVAFLVLFQPQREHAKTHNAAHGETARTDTEPAAG